VTSIRLIILRIRNKPAIKAPEIPLALTSVDRNSEDIRVSAIVVAELKFSDIQRHVFGAHFMERAHDAALEDRPEAFDCLSMDGADHILAFCVIDCRVRKLFAKMLVTNPLVGAEQADFVRHRLAHEGFKRACLKIVYDAGDHITFSAHGAGNSGLSGTDAASSLSAAAFILVLILGEAANESFVNLDDAAKFFDILHQGDADFMAHFPSGFVRAETHVPVYLMSAHPFLADKHQVNNAVPIPQRFVGVFEDRADRMGEPIACGTPRRAFSALPMPFTGRQIINCWVATSRTPNAFWPAARDKVSAACVLVRKHLLELGDAKLMDRLGLLATHSFFPSMEGYCHA
jgi:hypothetical protein